MPNAEKFKYTRITRVFIRLLRKLDASIAQALC